MVLFCSAVGRSQLNEQDSVITDNDGNTYPIKLFPDNNLWTTANLKMNIPGSYCYDDKNENCRQYGRIYTWEAANRACPLLGEGWRLPANSEWWELTKLHGGMNTDTTIIRQRAYLSLLAGGTAGFNALLGGGRDLDGRYARSNAHGFYWTSTSTESNNNTAYFYNFAKGSKALYQQYDGEKERAFSVRCVKSVDVSK